MRLQIPLVAVAIPLLFAGSLHAQVRVGQLLPDTRPGSEFAVAGENLVGKRIEATLEREGTSRTMLPVAIDAASVKFSVPAASAPGAYLLRVKINDEVPQFVGQLTVVAPQAPAKPGPIIHRTEPTGSWTDLWWHGLFDLDIVGERLPARPDELTAPDQGLTLRLGDEPLVATPCAPPRTTAPTKPGSTTKESGGPKPEALNRTTQARPCYALQTPQRFGIHGLSAREYGGPRLLSIETTAGKSNAVSVRISRVTPRMVKWLSLFFLAFLIGAVLRLGRDVFAAPGGGTTKYRVASWVLLDPQTNTYSLSKLQLLLWMITISYCFVFLQLALVFVQGKLRFAPLPEGFQWLLGITGGTSLTAAMLTRSRGAKGAGDAGPALSDLVSSGGMLAPDRAQFLVWTLIGCCGYVLIVLSNATEAIETLPTLHADLLSAMGITALVYVGGKSVRLPGPVINQVTLVAADKTFTVKGQNLHRNAVISLDRQPIGITEVKPTPEPPPGDAPLLSRLEFKVEAVPFETGDHLLRVTNLDGQYAEAWFAADLPVIATVLASGGPPNEVRVGKAPTSLELSGSGFRAGSSAEWLPPGQKEPTAIPSDRVAVTAPQTARVTVTPGDAVGAATITLVSPHGTRAQRQVTITSPTK